MPPILSKPSSAARMAVVYVTVGALIVVWTVIWYVYLRTHAGPEGPFYWCYGLFFTGLTLLAIGLALGRIGRAARHAELPPEAPRTPTAQPPVLGQPAAMSAPGAPAAGPVMMVPAGSVLPNGTVVAPAAPAPPPPQPPAVR